MTFVQYAGTSTSNSVVWDTWNTTSAVTTAGSGDIWVKWCGTTSSTTSTLTIDTSIWDQWTYIDTRAAVVQPQRVHTDAELREPQAARAVEMQRIKEMQAENDRRYNEMRTRQALAEKRAEELLLSNISLVDRVMFLEKKHIIVQGRHDRYRLNRGTHGNIDVIGRDGRIKHRLCAQPNGIPTCDAVLAQKLSLEHDEASFLKIANKHAYTGDKLHAVLPALN